MEHMQIFDNCYLARSGCLYDDPELTGSIIANADIRLYRKGDFLYVDSEINETLFILLKGRIESYYLENGKKRTIGLWSEATCMGAAMMIARKKHATVRCKTDCTLALISSEQMRELEKDPAAIMLLLRMQAEKMRMMFNQIKSLSFDSAQDRLMIFLYEAAMHELCMGCMDIPVRISFSRQEIADLINSSREYVSSMLKELRKKYHIEVNGNEIIVIPGELEAYLKSQDKEHGL